MKDNIKEFLNDTSNFNNIKHRSEADLQFELGYFLKSKKKFNFECDTPNQSFQLYIS